MGFRVLIVDDSPLMRTFIGRVFQTCGFEVSDFFWAGNGKEALSLLAREWVDVVLTDINMPAMDGAALVAAIRAQGLEIPVIVVSTDATELRVQEMIRLGASGYVKKPFTPEALKTELDRVLGTEQ